MINFISSLKESNINVLDNIEKRMKFKENYSRGRREIQTPDYTQASMFKESGINFDIMNIKQERRNKIRRRIGGEEDNILRLISFSGVFVES